MSLTKKQKLFIKNNLKSKSASDFAKQFSIDEKFVDEFINELENKHTPKWFYLIIIIIPIVFFFVVEYSLRLFNYGDDFSVFIPVTQVDEYLLVFNPKYPHKFFANTQSIPSVIPDAFEREKSQNTFRVFVLGGSTTAGFPFSYNATFARYVKRRYEILYPKTKIEVINMGISAVNSYTIKDLIPEIINHNPDLVLIYAGHNEYYGALGVASSESSHLNNLALSFRNTKTYQLTKDGLKIFSSTDQNESSNNKTLMSQLVGHNLVEYESKEYYAGIEQFENNFDYTLELLSNYKINTIVSTVTSNLLQKPFESVEVDNSADYNYYEGIKLYESEMYNEAKEYLVLAKEKDALKFRAPEEINHKIKKLTRKYNIELIDADSLFSSESPGRITGYNWMVDHLHPTVEGHQKLGKWFFNKILESSYLPKTGRKEISVSRQEEMMASSLSYTRFDSVYSEVVLSKLLNSYPFTELKGLKKNSIILSDYIDSLAANTANGKISWELGHIKAAEYYFNKKNYQKFIAEMMTLIDDRPFVKGNYTFAIEKLLSSNKLNSGLGILLKMSKYFNDDYSAKWLGTIALQRKLFDMSIFYYEKYLEQNSNDAQILFNIAGAYYFTRELVKAKLALEKCLKISPNFPEANKVLNKINMEIN